MLRLPNCFSYKQTTTQRWPDPAFRFYAAGLSTSRSLRTFYVTAGPQTHVVLKQSVLQPLGMPCFILEHLRTFALREQSTLGMSSTECAGP